MMLSVGTLLAIVFILQVVFSAFLPDMFGNSVSNYFILLFVQVFSLVVPVFVFSRIKTGERREFFKSKKIKLSEYLYCIALVIFTNALAQYANFPFIYIFEKLGIYEGQSLISTPNTYFDIFVTILITAVLPALVEEVLFRGYVLDECTSCYGVKKGIFLSAIIFALMHADISSFVPQFLIGLMLAYVTVKFGSLILPMFCHFLNNSVSLAIQIFLSMGNITATFFEGLIFKFFIASFIIIILFNITKYRVTQNSYIVNCSVQNRAVLSIYFKILIILYLIYHLIVIF